MSRVAFLLKLGDSARYRNYKYVPLKGLDMICVAKMTSDITKKPCASLASRKTGIVKMSCEETVL